MAVKLKCSVCGRIYASNESTANEGTYYFCSNECGAKSKARGILFPRITIVERAGET